MATAGAVVDRLLRRLATDARQLELPSNIDGDVAHVRRTLSRLQDVLVRMEEQYFMMVPEAQDWMGKIKQFACDMDDLLDGFVDHNSSGSQSILKAPSFCSSSPFLLFSTRVIRMKTLRRRLDHLAKDSVIFSFMHYSSCDLEQSGNQDEFDRAAIVGRDNDRAKIKDLILQYDADTLLIIPIVGLVGLGKTTLARLIFHDQGQGWNFDLRIWINLNRKLDLKKIARDIILQANRTIEERTSEVNSNTEIHENLQLLKNCLQELLCDKHCLIVLNGLSSIDKSKLDELKEMLNGTNNFIKILVTTSSERTAELMNTVPPYKLPPLSEDDCWTIFSDKAFGDGNDVNACLKEIGRQIVKRCEGIPALARSLGSIVHNQVMDVWLAVRDEALWKLEKTYSTKVKLFSLFYHIYHDMPSALKLCFLYLSVFPKGSVLDKEKLIRQWIALDMIGSKHETLPSYVQGEMYIQDLLSIHFLQVQKTHSVNEIVNKTAPTMLYMHNVIHDFTRHIASNDSIILDGGEINRNAKSPTFQYILLTYYRGQSTLCSPLITRARALHFQNTTATELHKEKFNLPKHLRVLNLSGSCIGEIPASIGHLKHLRYLDISDLKIQTLPSSVSNLTKLEALDLSNTSLKQLPSSIGTLPKLKYLNLQGCDKLQTLPPTLGHLQRLEHLRLSCCYDISELSISLCNLHDLRILDLSSCTELQQLPPSFGNLMNMEDLNLSGCFSLKQLPESFGNLYFLRFLNISSCYELQQLPGSLTDLRKLEVLILRRCRRLQNLPPCFENIQCLRILDLAGCEALHISTEILTTNLEYLNLQRCRKLQTQPNCFENFTELKFLNLSQCHTNIHNLLNLSQAPPNVYYFQSLGYLSKLEYLNLSQTVLDIPVSFERLQKLHTLDLTGSILIHPSSGVPRTLPDMIQKMAGLKFVLTKDPTIVASLPQHVRCSVDIDEHWHIATDELVIPDLSGGSRGLGIAEKVNLQNRLELRFLKLEWMPTSQSAAGEVVEYAGEEEVLEKLQPNHCLEHFELVGYAGSVFPTWMMSNMMSLLPNLVSLHIFHLENCKNLPPLGDLRNLRYLYIKDVPNLTNLDMGLSGGTHPFKKLTHLNMESLFNLEEFSILLPTSSEEQFMFPALEELSVISCCKLMFKPSLPKCLKYEIKESNNILLCGEPIGPTSSSPVQIEITGCMIPSSLLQWIRSLRTLEKAVIDACVGEDGQVLTSVGLLETMSNEEGSSRYAAHETTTVSPLETTESIPKVSTPTAVEHINTENINVKSTTGKDVEVVAEVCTDKDNVAPRNLEYEKSAGGRVPFNPDGPTSLTFSRGKDTDAGNGSGSLSTLSGLGRAARRQLAATLDEFWGHLFDYHGKITQEANDKRYNFLLGLDLKTASSTVRADHQTAEASKSPLMRDAMRGSPTSLNSWDSMSRDKEIRSLDWNSGHQMSAMGSPSWSQSMNLPYTDISSQNSSLLEQNAKYYSNFNVPSYSDNQFYQPATIHGYELASYLKGMNASRSQYSNIPLDPRRVPRSSEYFPNYAASALDARSQNVRASLGANSLQSPTMNRLNAAVERPYYDSNSVEESESVGAYSKKYHSSPDISALIAASRKALLNEANLGGAAGNQSYLSKLASERSQYVDPTARSNAQVAFNESPQHNLQRNVLSMQLGMNPNTKSLWAQQPFEQLFGVSSAELNKSEVNTGQRSSGITKHDSSYTECEAELLQSLRFCILKILKVEGSGWLFRQNGGCDENLIDQVAAAERLSQEPTGSVLSADLRRSPSDKSSQPLRRNDERAANCMHGLPNCGETCVWQGSLVVSFGVWCIRRVLDLSLVESRPELWGKYTYVLNRLQGILEPAFSTPRKSLTACACLQVVGPVARPISGIFTTSAVILEKIKDVEQAISGRKGRSGTAAGDVAFPKGKENLASVLKRYKRRLSSKPPAGQ